MKLLVKVAGTATAIAVGVWVLLALWSQSMQKEIHSLYEQKQPALSLQNGVAVKDKGNSWIEESSLHKELFVCGSSELSASVQQNIKNNFPSTEYNAEISPIGHAYVQNMLHAMNFGANYDSFKDRNIVLVESIQWFDGDDISSDGYMANFSELQFYEFLHNDKISKKNKTYLCNRFLEVEKGRISYQRPEKVNGLINKSRILKAFGLTNWFSEHQWLRMGKTSYDFPQTHVLAELYASENVFGNMFYQCMRPYYAMRSVILKLKDQYDTIAYLRSVNTDCSKSIFEANWDIQIEQAEQDGIDACHNNDIYVADDYYSTYLEKDWEQRKNSINNKTNFSSKEWGDFQFMLSVCNELDIKPYLVNVPTNGYYYDYIGVDPKIRQEHYAKVSKMASEYQVPIYNGLIDKEYEPYVFVDVMHLGWKGWIYVTQAITEHFKQ